MVELAGRDRTFKGTRKACGLADSHSDAGASPAPVHPPGGRSLRRTRARRRLAPATGRGVRGFARTGLLSLPVSARGPVSDARHRRPPTRCTGCVGRAPHRRCPRRPKCLSSSFSSTGCVGSACSHEPEHAPGGCRLRKLAPVRGAGRATGERQSCSDQRPRGGLQEWYANGPLGLEQGFTSRGRPPGPGGPADPCGLSRRLRSTRARHRTAERGLRLRASGRAELHAA